MKKYIYIIIGTITLLSIFILIDRTYLLRDKKVNTVALSPDGRFIVFSLACKGVENIYRCKTNGKDLICLTQQNHGKNYDPVYSPDGTKIVFASVKDDLNNADLFVMDANGSNVYRLTTGLENDDSPVWSPDGKCIYFVRSRWYGHYSPIAKSHWHEMDIYSVNVDGTELKAITNKKYFQISGPSIFPDGKQILIQKDKSNRELLWIFPIDNPEKIELISPNLENCEANYKKPFETKPVQYDGFYYPRVSPDGNSILFTWAGCYQGYFGHEIYIMNLKTKETKKLTDMRSYIEGPSFSADGSKIIFLADKDYSSSEKSNFKIYIVNIDGSNLRKVKIDL